VVKQGEARKGKTSAISTKRKREGWVVASTRPTTRDGESGKGKGGGRSCWGELQSEEGTDGAKKREGLGRRRSSSPKRQSKEGGKAHRCLGRGSLKGKSWGSG